MLSSSSTIIFNATNAEKSKHYVSGFTEGVVILFIYLPKDSLSAVEGAALRISTLALKWFLLAFAIPLTNEA